MSGLDAGLDPNTFESDENNKEDDNHSIHAAMAEKIAKHKAANQASEDEQEGGGKLEAAAEAFELSLEMDPEPEPEDESGNEFAPAQRFGMGRIS